MRGQGASISLRMARRLVPWMMLAASVALGVWYAKNQLLFSLHFLYQIARAFFPTMVPDFGAPG